MDTFGFNRESVAWVVGYIERQRARLAPELCDGVINVLGSFLGECIVRCYGGTWRADDEGWGIHFGDGNAAYPFNKVRKQFENGVNGGDSILGFFDSIPVLFRAKE